MGEKKVTGRKRHLLVDTLGFILKVIVTAANLSDGAGARQVLAAVRPRLLGLTKLWADSAYQGVVKWLAAHWAAVSLEIVKGRPEQVGFEVQPKRWIVERTFGWLNYWRRLSKDYEYLHRSSESMIYVASIRIMLRRIVKQPSSSSVDHFL